MAQSPGLVIANIADPSAPQVIGSFTAAQVPSRIEVQGHLAYLAEGNAGLEIVDVSDPSSPQLVGAIKTPGTAEDVIVAGGYAYVADGGAGLTIIDVSVPGSPEILSTNDIGAAATDLDVAGSRAYVIDTTAGLEIIDISNPASPQLLGACPGTAQARDVKVVGTTAYLANQGKLMVIDATQPQSPIVLANVACFAGTGGAALSVEVAGDIAYLTGVFRLSNTSNVLFTACAFDITDPSAPKVVMPMQLTGGRMLRFCLRSRV
jgi:hypothetical protein